MCTTCSKNIHSQKIHKNHTVVSTNQKRFPNTCSDHPDEKIKLWCTICENHICRDCLLFKHKDHTYTSLQDIVQETKSKIQSSLQPIRENLEKAAVTADGIIEQQHQHYTTVKLDIDEAFKKLQSFLEIRKSKLIQQLDSFRAEETSILEKYQADMNEQLKTIKAREVLVQQMFDNNDSIQIMKMKKTLLDYDQQINQQCRRLEQGCTFAKASFNVSTDMQQKIAEYGVIKSENVVLAPDGAEAKKNNMFLDLSRPLCEYSTCQYETSYGRGYVFQLKNPLKIRSVQLEASIHGQVVIYVVNNSGVVVNKTSLISNDITMKWTTIPIIVELNTGYSILVWSPNKNGRFSYKSGDNNFRTINSECSVESKCAAINHDLSIGEQLTINRNTYSIQMMIDIEK
ncbi:unnamed protein product [Rotaria sp. Silwood2]|nr:unnamed protein product [Rotaria sp. Silwood2]CAF4614023.1 unnamed protein product [Rotaria sp. Silwood2]